MFRNKALWKFARKQPRLSCAWTFCTFRSSHLNNYFEIYTLHNSSFILYTMDDFNFTNFLIDRVMGCSTKGTSYCCFRKPVSSNYFQKVLLINFISTYANCLTKFRFAHFLLIEGYRKYYLRKESVIASFIERFKIATLRKSSKRIFLILTAACLNLSALLTF